MRCCVTYAAAIVVVAFEDVFDDDGDVGDIHIIVWQAINNLQHTVYIQIQMYHYKHFYITHTYSLYAKCRVFNVQHFHRSIPTK